MKVQIFQFYVEYGNVEKNENKIKSWFENKLEADTEVVVLPEMWNNGYALNELNQKADRELSRSFPFIQSLAQQYHVDIVAGSVSNIRNGKVYNTAFTVSREGHRINKYDKVHLVPMLDEPTYLEDGKAVPEPFSLSSGTLATQIICYDLRFPELLRYPARNGAQVAFYVAQWPTPRLNHWKALLQARAIENDIFIIACNGTGNDGNTDYAGHSMIINPNGEILAELGNEEDTIAHNIDLKEVDIQRETIPVFKNLKPNLYK
ncbi:MULTISPECIES: carbon-nitrogen family hydrolase [Staphylococcus]|uniref:carbon-nitrogen family hydrolase n=1 Tax=Staphylococcus sp. GDY8P47P TaxID=2804491 RepID=UPI00194FA172|nr:carbon-nitrogen family hydrolase [Staphylococcus sp. GDY8P47P]